MFYIKLEIDLKKTRGIRENTITNIPVTLLLSNIRFVRICRLVFKKVDSHLYC